MSGRALPPAGPNAVDWARVVQSVAAGDRAAFARIARLVTGYLARWRAFDFRDDWDDVVQEVVVAVVQAHRKDRLGSPEALPAYVRQATRFKLIDRLRRRRRDAPEAAGAETGDALQWPPNPDELGPETRLSLWKAVDDLNEKERVAVVEVYARGKSYEQAAKDNDIPLGSLKRYLREGLRALKATLGEES